jgi:hypothetical protein
MNTRYKYLAVLVFGWTLIAVITTSQTYIEMTVYEPDRPFPILQMFVINVLQWNFWTAVTPLIGWLGRRFPIEKGKFAKAVPVHVLASIIVAAIHIAYIVFLTFQLAPVENLPRDRSFFRMFLNLSYTFHIELMIYWAMLGMTYAVDYYSKFRERELRASQLETQLAQANLQALEMQLQPHFLFNTLNGIATLVRDKRDKDAVEMLVGVSELLRQVLDNMGRQEVTLKEEIDFIERYLEIQQMRFGDRLVVSLDIAPETLDARVPNLVLQPIVENAIRHGLSHKIEVGHLRIRSERSGDDLLLAVQNDGEKLDEAFELNASGGLGLTNTRERLEQLFGTDQKFSLRNTEDGVVATIRIPFVTE